MKKQKDEIAGMLWQDVEEKDTIEFLTKAIAYFEKKYGTVKEIRVSLDFPLKEFGEILLIPDGSFYNKNIILLIKE